MKLSELIREELRISAETGSDLPKAITARLHECVKPLEWRHPSSANFKKGECFHARGAENHYAVHQHREGWWFNTDSKTYPTLEAAKAAAQAHYAAQIIAGVDL